MSFKRVIGNSISLSACLVLLCGFAGSANGADATFQAKLEKEEATWHKFMLFRLPFQAKTREELITTLGWFETRTQSRKNIDSRYAATYSAMLWATKDPRWREQSIGYAISAYVAMQIEAARCASQAEGAAFAAQWNDAIRSQMMAFRGLPPTKRMEIGDKALRYVSELPQENADEPRAGPLWICYLVPSYMARIGKEPGVMFDNVAVGAFTNVFVSHPDIKPALAPDTEFEARRQGILKAARSGFDNP